MTEVLMWHGDYLFLLMNLTASDFRVRYRNMSLGVLWSLLNPIILMAVLTFIFTRIIPNPRIPNYPVFILCGLVPYNFFTISWTAGTTSILNNGHLVKRVPFPREILPLAAVLSNLIHLLIQVGLLFTLLLAAGKTPNRYWLWLPLIWALEVLFVTGLSLITSALNVFVRDMRYVVESVNMVLFWLVPVFYSFSVVPQAYAGVYEFNPVAALVLAMRNILLEASAPPAMLLWKLALSSTAVLAGGWLVFRNLKPSFYDHL